ncbi:MAG: ABC transporter substrate-binding protein, partial [Chloroflexota bacterium]|nr:ABC transporter substrate-binding protein [Chloroflexota bacterium]
MSYRNIRRPRRAALKLLLVTLAVGALLAVACGAPDATPSPTAAPASRATPTPTPTLRAGVTPAPTPSPSSGQSLRGELTRLWADPPTLDPHLTRDATSAMIIVEVFSGLVTFDTDLKLVPDIAETWDIGPDGTVYTFRLRQDARFHDGKPVTAEDFRWSIERAADPATQSTVAEQYLGDIVGVKDKLRGKAKEISGLKVNDERTLQLTIDAPKSYFLDKLTYPTAFVLDRANVEGKKDWTRQPNGAGPFKLASYTPGERVTLERNPNFHLGPPKLERVKL